MFVVEVQAGLESVASWLPRPRLRTGQSRWCTVLRELSEAEPVWSTFGPGAFVLAVAAQKDVMVQRSQGRRLNVCTVRLGLMCVCGYHFLARVRVRTSCVCPRFRPRRSGGQRVEE